MLRTAKVFKLFSYGGIATGVYFACERFSITSPKFWIVIFFSAALGVMMRLLAIIGELIYGMRNDSARMLTSIERSLYQSNATTKEIRDLIDSQAAENNP